MDFGKLTWPTHRCIKRESLAFDSSEICGLISDAFQVSLRSHRSTFHKFMKMLAVFDIFVVLFCTWLYSLPVISEHFKSVNISFLEFSTRSVTSSSRGSPDKFTILNRNLIVNCSLVYTSRGIYLFMASNSPSNCYGSLKLPERRRPHQSMLCPPIGTMHWCNTT